MISTRIVPLAAKFATKVAGDLLLSTVRLRIPARGHGFLSVTKNLSLLRADVPPKDAEQLPNTPEQPSKNASEECVSDLPSGPERTEIAEQMAATESAVEVKVPSEIERSGDQEATEAKKATVVMIPWMLAQPRQVLKYTELYTSRGMDVLLVKVRPWHVLLPEQGGQAVAVELLEYLLGHGAHDPLVVHGFSVGGYIWGEICVKAVDSGERYKSVMRRFTGQVWDSVVDVGEVPVGLSSAVFPNNPRIRGAFQGIIEYHMRTFHEASTRHYLRAGALFRDNLIKAPALLFVCKSDVVSSEKSNLRLRESWAEQGITTYYKCWDKSSHVGHYFHHPLEYAAELNCFLDTLHLEATGGKSKDERPSGQ